MEDSQFSLDGFFGQIDWNDFFHEFSDSSNALVIQPPTLPHSTLSIPSSDSFSPSITEIENILMKDDEDKGFSVPHDESSHSFLADVLLDSHGGESSAVDAAIDVDSNASDCVDDFNISHQKVDATKMGEGGDADLHDPISKKRTRQLRNKDAAVRSRERKKMYVKDLEIKSKFLEGECRRLGRLLQCYYAENQALRFSLQMGCASGASLAKQESAVLLLESLLLGSLLWLVGVVCLFSLPKNLRLTVDQVPRVNMAEKSPRSGGLNWGGNKNSVESFLQTRRCKAARSRMKSMILEAMSLVFL